MSDFKRGCDGELPDSVSLIMPVERVIADRRRKYEETGDPKHLNYEKKYTRELKKKGGQNPEIRRNYKLEDTVEEGNFVSRDRLTSCGRVGLLKNGKPMPTDQLFFGPAWARVSDNTWIAISNRQNDILTWLKIPHLPYEEQIEMILAELKRPWIDGKPLFDRIVGVKGDSTGQGDMPMEYLQMHSGLPVGQESHVKFTLQSKNDMYTVFEQAIFKNEDDPYRFSYAADYPLAAEFEEQMVALLREYKATENTYLFIIPPNRMRGTMQPRWSCSGPLAGQSAKLCLFERATSMHPFDFLNHAIVDLPKTRNGNFRQFMEKLFNAFVAHVNAIDVTHPLGQAINARVMTIRAECDALLRTVDLLSAGDRAGAAAELDKVFTLLGPHFRALCPTNDMSGFVNPMYRFRISNDPALQRDGLFHVGFQYPERMKSMRYSVAGHPCLYLGGSTYVCWREMNTPLFSEVFVSRFSALPNTQLRVLNFGHRFPVLAALVDSEPDKFTSVTSVDNVTSDFVFVLAQVTCWPLVAICSIRVPDRTVVERPEYDVPQMVLEWIVRTQQFHGVRYFSTHYPEYHDNPKLYINYAFPATVMATTGVCSQLASFFHLTEPKRWGDAKALPPVIAARPFYQQHGQVLLPLENEFGHVEDVLGQLPFAPV